MALLPAVAQANFELTPVKFAALPSWKDGQVISGFKAFKKCCKAGGQDLPKWDSETKKKLCREALHISDTNEKAIKSFLEHYFQPYEVRADNNNQGFFTGYYQPVVQASRIKTNKFKVPIYKRPSDLLLVEDLGDFRDDLAGFRFAARLVGNRLEPYFTRKEIDQGAIAAQGLEIAWVESPVEAFFLAVQGSGLLQFEDGFQMSIGYSGANGHPYSSIGKEMIRQGLLDEHKVSMKSIKEWFEKNPSRINDILHVNKSYIFFQELKELHPAGAQEAGLTPEGSLAVDPRFIELGSLLWLSTEIPAINSLVMAQDVGSAIKGPIRGDYYWGTGPEAGQKAGSMSTKGSYYLLKPKI